MAEHPGAAGVDEHARPAAAGHARRSPGRPGSRPRASAPARSSAGTRPSPRGGRRARPARRASRLAALEGVDAARQMRKRGQIAAGPRAGGGAGPAGSAGVRPRGSTPPPVSAASRRKRMSSKTALMAVDARERRLRAAAALEQLRQELGLVGTGDAQLWRHGAPHDLLGDHQQRRRRRRGSARWRPSAAPTARRAAGARPRTANRSCSRDADHLEHPTADPRGLLGGGELEVVEAQHGAHRRQLLAAPSSSAARKSRSAGLDLGAQHRQLAHHPREALGRRHGLARLAARGGPYERASTLERPRSRCPSHTNDHRMWETGTSDSFITVENGAARICSAAKPARTTKPGEHVPRMPMVSHVPAGSSSVSAAWRARAPGRRSRRRSERRGVVISSASAWAP